MSIRAFIIDDDEFILSMLNRLLSKRGYEVITLPNPTMCPAGEGADCQCGEGEACGDIAIFDLNLDMASGLDVVEEMRQRGCKLSCVALMSGQWSSVDLERAAALGCRTFQKPFSITEITAWLDECEVSLDPTRILRPRVAGE